MAGFSLQFSKYLLAAATLIVGASVSLQVISAEVDQYGLFEQAFPVAGEYDNPYVELNPVAELRLPDGSERSLPLFWDGGRRWRIRLSPDQVGAWSFKIRSDDQGLNGRSGSFNCVSSNLRGSLRPRSDSPQHFQYQNGDPVWFMGDTAWALFTDNADEKHDRAAAEYYLRTRAGQGFNVVHSMLLSEAGWGNSGGLPFLDLSREQINPAYWQEVDRRVAFANKQGLVVGLAIAWGDKRQREPFAWRRFPNLEARKRYARYAAARYGAYNVYFLVSGEWHAEIKTRRSTEARVRQEFVEIGNTLASADAHDRMIGIHPMTNRGSVREFNAAAWMSFGDYQQNYRDLHGRILESRRFNKPVVNSEYGYHLRDQNGDGTPDKDNSTSLESIRHASWDIVMAGGYLITGFGTTYFGGNRDPGPFDVDAPQNDDWERQIGFIQNCFTNLSWWRLEPHDDWLSCAVRRGEDGRQLGRIAPPTYTYWLMADPGRHYLAYARGVSQELILHLGPKGQGDYRLRLFNPRTGTSRILDPERKVTDEIEWTPPDENDWVLHLTRRP